jgi:hypothetical protein
MNKVVFAAIQTMIGKALSRKKEKIAVLNPWTQGFFDKIDNLKFLSYLNADGYPEIIPVIQAQSLDRQHLVFSFGAYGSELEEIPANASVAVFGMALSMEDVLVRGTYKGIRKVAGMKFGVVELTGCTTQCAQAGADLP